MSCLHGKPDGDCNQCQREDDAYARGVAAGRAEALREALAPQHQEDERKRFEAWAKSVGWPAYWTDQTDGVYCENFSGTAWDAWKAAIAAPVAVQPAKEKP